MQQQITTKIEKREIVWFNPLFSLNFSANIGREFFSLLDRHFLKTHQLHELLNSNNVKVSYISYFKSAINSHNKNMLTEQEKHSPCNCRDKTSYQLNGCYQYKNLIYSCKVSTPAIKKYHPHYIGLTEHKFKDEKDNRFFKYVSK